MFSSHTIYNSSAFIELGPSTLNPVWIKFHIFKKNHLRIMKIIMWTEWQKIIALNFWSVAFVSEYALSVLVFFALVFKGPFNGPHGQTQKLHKLSSGWSVRIIFVPDSNEQIYSRKSGKNQFFPFHSQIKFGLCKTTTFLENQHWRSLRHFKKVNRYLHPFA